MVKQKKLEIMATIESTTNLADNKNSANNGTELPLTVEGNENILVRVDQSSSKLIIEDELKNGNTNGNGKRHNKKELNPNSPTHSPILSPTQSTDSIDTADFDEKLTKENQISPNQTTTTNLLPSSSTITRQHSGTHLKTVNFRDNIKDANGHNNDTINSTASIGNVIFLPKNATPIPSIPAQPINLLNNTHNNQSTEFLHVQKPFNSQENNNPNTSQNLNSIENENNDENKTLLDETSKNV